QAHSEQSISIEQTATATVTEKVGATDQTDATVIRTTVIAFEAMEARVFALEAALVAIREQRAVGIGHNRGPDSFKPWSADDEKEIRYLVALLRQQTPASVVKREELVATAEKASKIAEKLREYADDFCRAAAKRGGEKFAEGIFSLPWWV